MVSQAVGARETILTGHMDSADTFAMCILSIGVHMSWLMHHCARVQKSNYNNKIDRTVV